MLALRLFTLLSLFSYSLHASASISTTNLQSDMEEILLPNFSARHEAFISASSTHALEDKEKLVAAFSNLSAVYHTKAKFLLDLSNRKSIYTYLWRDQSLENYLPDHWSLQKIDASGLSYICSAPFSLTPSEALVQTIDLKALSRRFLLVAYYYNRVALDRTQKDEQSAYLRTQELLENDLCDPAFAPFWSWTLSCSYIKEPLSQTDDPKNPHHFAKKQALELYQHYRNLQTLSENYGGFYKELEFETLNGIILRPSSATGHYDISSFHLQELQREYAQQTAFFEDRLACTESALQISPRSREAMTVKRRMVDVNTENEIQELKLLQKHSLFFAIISSDFLDMPKAYASKLHRFSDPSRHLHREATHATLSRVAKFFENNHHLLRHIFHERMELMLSRIMLLRSKKQDAPFPALSAFIFRQYLLADSDIYEHTLNHLITTTNQYATPSPSATPSSSAMSHTSSTENHEGKPHKRGFLTSVISKVTGSASTTKTQTNALIIHQNPVFGLPSLQKTPNAEIIGASLSASSIQEKTSSDMPLLSLSMASQDLRLASTSSTPLSPRTQKSKHRLLRLASLRALIKDSDSTPSHSPRQNQTPHDDSKNDIIAGMEHLSLDDKTESKPSFVEEKDPTDPTM